MANYSQSTLNGALTTTSATMLVQGGKGALFQINQLATLYAAGVIELVLITGIAGDTLSITRAQSGTAAAAWPSGTKVMQGMTGGVVTTAVNAAITNFTSGATMTGAAQQTTDGTANFHSVRKSYADATYYPANQPYQPALGYIPIRKGWNSADTVGIGWNGNLYAYVDGVYKGVIWTSVNYNPAWNAVSGSNCNWNSGIAEIGRAVAGVGGQATVDSGNPWVMEGWRTDSNALSPYVRAVWLRNN